MWGENVTQEDIKAKFEDGILKICVPKVENKPQIEEKQIYCHRRLIARGQEIRDLNIGNHSK